MKAIADTGFLVAFGNRNDFHHAWAVEIAGRITEPLLTCEAVLAETAFQLGSSALVLAFLSEGMVRSGFTLSEHTGAVGGTGGAVRGPKARPGGPLPDSDERTAPAVSRDHHGPSRFPGVPAGQAGDRPVDVSPAAVTPPPGRESAS
jgi:hypothetical protein